VANVSFEKSADCQKFYAFLETLFNGDDLLIEYIQKLCGYCLSGQTDDQGFYILLGDGANGKSTFLRVIQDVLGDYVAVVPSDALLARRSPGGVTPYLATLSGKRLVVLSEFNERDRLDEGRLKSLTGSDAITANAKYKAPYTFIPQFKILVATNHFPSVRGNDDGIWRRLKPVPFVNQFTGSSRIPNFHEQLLEEASGILNYFLEGWKIYQATELKPPPAIISLIKIFRDEEDDIGQYLSLRMVQGSNEKSLLPDVYPNYCEWCRDEGVTPISKQHFQAELRSRGFKIRRATGNYVTIFGLSLDSEQSLSSLKQVV